MVQTSKQMTQYDFEASSIAWWQFVLDLYLLSKYFYITLTCTIGSSVFDFKPGLTAGYRGRGSSTLWQDRRCLTGHSIAGEKRVNTTDPPTKDIVKIPLISKSQNPQVTLCTSGWK